MRGWGHLNLTICKSFIWTFCTHGQQGHKKEPKTHHCETFTGFNNLLEGHKVQRTKCKQRDYSIATLILGFLSRFLHFLEGKSGDKPLWFPSTLPAAGWWRRWNGIRDGKNSKPAFHHRNQRDDKLVAVKSVKWKIDNWLSGFQLDVRLLSEINAKIFTCPMEKHILHSLMSNCYWQHWQVIHRNKCRNHIY